MDKLPTLSELQEMRAGWRYLSLSDHPAFVPVDPDYVRHVQRKLAEGAVPTSILPAEVQLAAATKYLPPQKETAPFAIGFVQGAYIGSLVLPEWVSKKRKAAIPVLGNEKFAVNDKPIGTGGSVDEVDTSISWVEVELQPYGGETFIDDDERDESEDNLPPGASLEGIKLDRLVTAYDTLKEKHQATFTRDTANYATSPSNFYETLSGPAQWSDGNSEPVTDWARGRRRVEKNGLGKVDLGWLSGDAFTALRTNPQVVESVKYTGTRNAPGTMVPAETLVALFGMNLAIAGAVSAAYPGASPSEIWGQDAGMVCTGGGQVVGVRFAATATHVKYPYETTERTRRGGRGSDVLKHSDAWGLKGLKSNCGYLFTNASAAY